MMRSGSYVLSVALIAGLASTPILASGLEAAEMSPALKSLIKATEGEPPLKLLWATAVLGGAKGAKQIQTALNKMYGTNIEIKYAPGGAMPQLGNQLAAEFRAGRPASSDVHITALNHAARVGKMGVFQPGEYTKYLPGRIADELVELDGTVVKLVSNWSGITYNTNRIKNPPKTLTGWLAPEFKGRIATTPYASGFDLLGANDAWGPEKTLDFARKLSGQVKGLIRCAEMDRLASGEFWALVVDCGAGEGSVLASKGAPLGRVTPEDFFNIRFFYVTVPKNAQAPNSAKLFITFLMTEEGQKIAWETWNSDLHFFPESNLGKEVREFQKSGRKVTVLSTKWWHDHPEAEKVLEETIEIFRTAQK